MNKKVTKFFTTYLHSYSGFSIKQKTFFAKRLSFLIKSGVPLLESIQFIKDQAKSKSEIKVFDKIITDISNGQTLAMSLSHFRKLFGNFVINIIKAGESSGTLAQNLEYLALELKNKEILRKKIMSSFLYPIIILIATIGITLFLTVYIFPKILPIFQNMQIKLPLSTRIVIFTIDVFHAYGIYILIGFFLLTIGAIFCIKYLPKVHFFYDGFILRIPFIGKIIKNYNLTNSNRTLGLLLKSNVSLSSALLITADTTSNICYKEAWENLSRNVTKGKKMSAIMNLYPALFPPITGHMIAVGEKSGNLSDTLTYLSQLYESEFEDMTKNLSNIIEPILMVIMGLMVGFIAISVITPIYDITSNLKR